MILSKLYRYRLIAVVSEVFSLILLAIAILCLLPYFAKYIMVGDLAAYLKLGLHIQAAIQNTVKEYIPTVFGGHDFSRMMPFLFCAFVSGYLNDISKSYRYRITYERLEGEMSELSHHRVAAHNVGKFKEFQEKMEKAKTSTRRDREHLLKELVEIKKELDTFGRDLAFLSMDVVDSTKMKEGEDKMMVEYDFDQYRQFVESKLKKNGCIKFAWTGDGLMSCFNTIENAVTAAKEILAELSVVNSKKNIRTDFRIRCGINSGFVYYDESKPLDQLTDRVLDIAGHMQKYAEPNTICLARSIIEPVDDLNGFSSANRLVDGYEAYQWKE